MEDTHGVETVMRYRVRMLVRETAVLENVVIEVRDGLIYAIDDGPFNIDLGNVAAMPGHVNAHSHAFQRGIRGRTEYIDGGRPGDDFWSWRARMYGLAQRLTPDQLYTVSRMAFLEMALAGVTTVGEFHYLHHQADGTPYDEATVLADRVIQAALDVGIRITLLRVAYERAGMGRAPEVHQRRFCDHSVDSYLKQVEALTLRWHDASTVQIGYAPHSVRAVSQPWLTAIGAQALRHGQVIHVHACEQRRELQECETEYGHGPIQVLSNAGVLGEATTIVHGTHLDDAALVLLKQKRPTVCACPTTERNLGDGFLPTLDLLRRNIPIALGSDGQSEIDMFQEARLLEYHERLRAEKRNVLAMVAPSVGGHQYTADVLWPMLNRHGARSLGIDSSDLTPGSPADFFTLDLTAPSLAGTHSAYLRSDCVFSARPRAIHSVYVAGKRIVNGGRHEAQERIIGDFSRVMKTLD